jgi:transmembrane sensor
MRRNTATGSLFFARPNSGAEWVMRMHSGITPAEEREMREWLLLSERNNTDLLRAETVWRLSGGLLADPEIQAELARLRVAPLTPTARRPLWRAFSGGGLAVAASIVSVFVAAGFYLLSRDEAQSYVTAAGEQRMVPLPDGSRVAINTDTALHVHFTRGERAVTMERGEALFQVQRDARRPFVVYAREGSVSAAGTRFNVLVRDDDVTVVVLDGAVSIDTGAHGGGAPVSYREGEAAAFHGGRLVDVDPTVGSAERIRAWREGKLRFSNWQVQRALDEYNRYALKPIRIDYPELERTHITLVMRIGDTQALVGALSQLRSDMDVQVVDRGQDYLLVRNTEAAASVAH